MKISLRHNGKMWAAALLAMLSCNVGWATLMTREQSEKFQQEQQKELEILRQSNDFNHSNDRATLDLLSTLKIDGVNWANQDIQWTLNDLSARVIGPGAAHLKFVIRWPENPNQPDVLGRRLERNVSFATNEKMSLLELLQGVLCRETNLSFKVERNEVIFMPWKIGNFIYLHALMDPM